MKKLSPVLIQLLHILSDQQFHSGDELGKTLNMTRAGIWKYIKQLQDWQLPLEAIKGKGYYLKQPLQLLDEKKLQQNLLKAGSRQRLRIFPMINSTNTYLKNKSIDCDICVAEMQSEGRARFERSWISPFGQNLYCSIKKHFDQDISMLSGLGLVIAVAIADVLNQLNLPESVMIKWPNDLYYQGKKLGGILIELMAESFTNADAIIGFGLNINMLPDHNDWNIDREWTSLHMALGGYFDRNVILEKLLIQVEQYMQQFIDNGFEFFQNRYQALSCLQGQFVTLYSGRQKIEGVVQGVTEQGYLILELPDGIVKHFAAGEVSSKPC